MSPGELPAAAAAAVPTGPNDARLEAIRRMPEGRARQAAARELQTVFLVQLLRAMRKTIPQNEYLPRAPERDVYEGVFDETVAGRLAERDPLGLGRSLEPHASSPRPTLPIRTVGDQEGHKR